MIGNFPAVLNFNQLFLKLNRFICNQLPVLPDHCCSRPFCGRCTWNCANAGQIDECFLCNEREALPPLSYR